MLLQLSIENFALIEKVSVDFHNGFNILSGETGAGKSILIDAINYVLGSKFSKDLIRHGEEKTFVEAIFDIENENVKQILEEEEIEYEELIIISRETFTNGKSIIKINGKTIMLSKLKKVSQCLIDIHGQHNNQNLLDKNNHILYLDSYAEIKLSPLLVKYEKMYGKLKELDDKITQLSGGKDRDKQLNYLKFQIDDINEGKLRAGEEEELNREYNILANAEKINLSLMKSYQLLKGRNDEEAILDNLSIVIRELSSIKKHSEKIEKIYNDIQPILYNLEELSGELRYLSEEVIYDEEELERINSRIYKLSLYKKKYGNTIEEILKYRDKLQAEYDELLNAEEIILKLEKEKIELQQGMNKLCDEMHKIRVETALILQSAVKEEMSYIGLEKCIFEVEITSVEEFTPRGKDSIQYLISTNPGEPLKPMEKVVSGGELSRIMLALKAVFVEKDNIPTVIFDEIDTGISGRIAQSVAEKMYQISTRHQVFCITHLPQIAAMSDIHYLVEKNTKNQKTFSKVRKINEEEKIIEIAKMLGGVQVTDTTYESSKEMVRLAEEKKKEIC